ncbi:MAG: hypothetical protein ACTSWX_01945 [Promethearchaeota archaeon]
MTKREMNEQANLVFEFLDKLYFETAYLIKEIEGLLKREDEEFIIGRPRGYGISAGSSTALEYPDWWWYKKFSVFFVPKSQTKVVGGKTITPFQKALKIIYLIINLTNKDISSPKIAIGTIFSIYCKSSDHYKKFEDATIYYLDTIWNLAVNNPKFAEGSYEDKYMKMKGRFIISDLFDINNTQDIKKKLLTPALNQYRKI